MATIDENLWYELLRDPQGEFRVIVRTDADAAPIAEECATHGMTVHRLFRLVSGLALTATGEALLALAADPHVTRIELDGEVGV